MHTWWRWLGISALLVVTLIPQWGVLAVPALIGACQFWLGQLPARRNQVAVLLMAVPAPWGTLAPLWSQHAWWQRLVLVLAIAAAWLPIGNEYKWALALGCALWPLSQSAQRDDVRWLIPCLHMAATSGWPPWWDVALAGVALVSGAWAWWHANDDQLHWSGALLCLGIASGAAIVVLPWVIAARVLRPSAKPIVALLAWWGIAMVLLASGNVWGLALVIWPLLDRIKRINGVMIGQQWVLLMMLLACPVQASVARMQPSLLVLGEVWVAPFAWQFRDAAQQAVGGIPWGPLVGCGVLVWAIWQLWQPTVVHNVD